MKIKLICIIYFFLCVAKIYCVDVKEINIDEYKISSQCTSLLLEHNESLNIYQENNDIYILGWSKDGKMAYIENRAIEGRGGHDFYFTIIDLVEDTVTHQLKKRWYDNDDYGESPEMALTFHQCLIAYSNDMNIQLNSNNIIIFPCKFQNFPAKDAKGNEVTCNIKLLRKELGEFNLNYMTYEIYAEKENCFKLINTINNKACDFVELTGFLKSPYEERVALIVADAEYIFEGHEVFINFYGCNLSSGFNKK